MIRLLRILNVFFLAILALLLLGLTPRTVAEPENSTPAQTDSSKDRYSGTITFTGEAHASADLTNPGLWCPPDFDIPECNFTADSTINLKLQFEDLSLDSFPAQVSTTVSIQMDATYHTLGQYQFGCQYGYSGNFTYGGDVEGSGTVGAILILPDDSLSAVAAFYSPDLPGESIEHYTVNGEWITGEPCTPVPDGDTHFIGNLNLGSFLIGSTADPQNPDHWQGSTPYTLPATPNFGSYFLVEPPGTLTWDITRTSNCNLPNPPPSWKQNDARWGNDPYGADDGTDHGKVKRYGCALTSTAMMLNQQGIDVDPGQLNTWLRSQTDGYKGSALNWAAVARYAREQGVTLYYHGKQSNGADADNYLKEATCDLSLPVVVEQPSPSHPGHSHFVLATGQATVSGTPTYTINDPGYNRTSFGDYANSYTSVRVFNHESAGALIGGGTDVLQVLVTDPLGRQTGVRADGSSVSDIPGSDYSTESIDDDDDVNGSPSTPERVAEITAPMDGTYIIQTFGVANGDYTMHFFSYDADQNPADIEIFNGTTTSGEAQTYVLNYASAPGAAVGVTRLVVDGTVQLQGRPSAPDARWAVPLHIVVTPQGGSTPVIDQQITTDASGQFELNGLTPGNYTVWVKGSHTLAAAQAVTVIAGANSLNLGTLREGDADGSNLVNLTDFSLLAATFGKQAGTEGYDERADFNGDGVVNLLDFSLLASNFGQVGAS